MLADSSARGKPDHWWIHGVHVGEITRSLEHSSHFASRCLAKGLYRSEQVDPVHGVLSDTLDYRGFMIRNGHIRVIEFLLYRVIWLFDSNRSFLFSCF